MEPLSWISVVSYSSLTAVANWVTCATLCAPHVCHRKTFLHSFRSLYDAVRKTRFALQWLVFQTVSAIIGGCRVAFFNESCFHWRWILDLCDCTMEWFPWLKEYSSRRWAFFFIFKIGFLYSADKRLLFWAAGNFSALILSMIGTAFLNLYTM